MGIDTAMAAALLVVRVYHGLDMVKADVRAGLSEAVGIMGRAAIAMAWIDCAPERREAAVDTRCQRPLAPHEVVLRILSTSPVTRGLLVPMGYTPVTAVSRRAGPADRAGLADRPVLATVYGDRVSRVARDAGVDGRLVLGRAVAHEIGHVLLNHPGHADRGLMRATWSRDQLRRAHPADWTFVDRDADAMRAALGARCQGRS